ncbi:MAG: BspA family leucine-rich repeat surface protein [Bacteroidales bacterium]|nr:BspA family leucine-rich repeat surface protein [Bacteroidales bacterium]
MNFCPECGGKLELKPSFCTNCGTEYREGQKFCVGCGTKLPVSTSDQIEVLSHMQAEQMFQEGLEYYKKGEKGADDPNCRKAFEYFMESAKTGNADAQYYLGVMYEYGEGVHKNSIKSEQWYSKAFASYKHDVDNGNLKSMVALGTCYRVGAGIEEDENKAVELYRKAFDNGYVKEAGYQLAICYSYGLGVEEDKKKAVEYYMIAAEEGSDNASCALGCAYYYGRGVDVNKAEAVKWLKKAIELGNGYSCGYEIGECYRLGEGVEKDVDIAIEWYKKAAEHGNPDSMFMLAEYSVERGGFDVALEWYKKALDSAKEWDHDFKDKINGRIEKYFNTDGTPSETAIKICAIKKNPSPNDAEGQYVLGESLIEDNIREAMECFKRSAGAGNDKALEWLIRIYTYAIDTNEDEMEGDDEDYDLFELPFWTEKSDAIDDDGEAFYWIQKSAEKGNAKACFLIGEYYYHGWDVEKNKTTALEWYRKAAKSGSPLYLRCVRITELELKYNVYLRTNTFFVGEGTKEISDQLQNNSKFKRVIFIPSSVTSIAEGAFQGCYDLETVICEAPQNIAVSSMKDMFLNCFKLKDISFLSEWNISSVKTMDNCFHNCFSLDDISPLVKWDVSNVSSMEWMFADCKSLKDISPLSRWDLSKATSIKHMFAHCSSLTNISALQYWGKSPKSIWWAFGIISDCNAITDISPLKKWGLTEKEIVQDLMSHWDDTSLSDYKKRSSHPVTPINSTATPKSESVNANNAPGIDPIEKSIPHVFFIQAVGFDITYPDGKCQHKNCGSSQGDMPSWTGTGFLLADGRFVTARHVVEAWSFPAGGGEVDNGMVALNIIANNGGKVVAKFVAISSNGTRIEFTSAQCIINRRNDKASLTDKGAKLVLAEVDNTDYAYFRTGRSSGLMHNDAASTTLARGAKLVVLGFPLGIGANSENDINPILGSGIVAAPGLQKGVILTTDTNYEQGNSGGPVFRTKANGDLEVIGLVSAGAGRTMGFIVPIAAVK